MVTNADIMPNQIATPHPYIVAQTSVGLQNAHFTHKAIFADGAARENRGTRADITDQGITFGFGGLIFGLAGAANILVAQRHKQSNLTWRKMLLDLFKGNDR